jgi:hypothetical protein
MFYKAEKETKIISLEENLITSQDVDIHVGTHMSLVKQGRSSVLALKCMIVKNSCVFKHLAKVYWELSMRKMSVTESDL